MSERILVIYTAIEYIESHLQKEITVADIAAAAGYSLYHFIRTFNLTVHHTPYDYLMRRRLSEATHDLMTSEARIIDIAVNYQFNNHETFSRAFKRMFNIQPSQWRERGIIPYQTLMPALTLDYLLHVNQGDFLPPAVIEWEATHLVGLMTPKSEHAAQLWKPLTQILDDSAIPVASRQFYGVTSRPQTQDNISFYFAGFETVSPETISPPLVIQTLPASSYIRFIHPGTDENLNLTLDYIYHTWLPKSDYQIAHPLEIECWSAALNSERTILIPIQPSNDGAVSKTGR